MKLALVNGFLGSGKTTAILAACQQLMQQNLKVAVITNDQGEQQVDSVWVKSQGIPGREVANGCFCCNYDLLDYHLLSLSVSDWPELIFAESVGSCTDLIATIAKPLGMRRPEFEISISIFTDGELLAGLMEGRSMFLEESVRYIYKKQMEEADILIINKCDHLTPSQVLAIDAVIRSDYPDKIILHQNSLIENDIAHWIQQINMLPTSKIRRSIELDYDVYGDGEAKLAWLDKSIEIRTTRNDAVFSTSKIISSIFNQIHSHMLAIGHLKFFIESDGWHEKISFTSTNTKAEVNLPDHKTNHVRLLINARVQTEPKILERLVDATLAKAEEILGCAIVHVNKAAFKPGYPRPTYRER